MTKSLPLFLWIKSGNIFRKFLTLILKIFDKNFERLQFVCLGMRANNPIIDQLNECFDSGETEIMNIGDSVRARRIIEGTEEARNILNVLDKRDFL